MNRKSLAFSVTLGLGLGLFACQDNGVVAPEDDAISPEDLVVAFGPDCNNPKFANHPQCNGGGEDPGGEPTLTMTGAFSGEALDGVTWNEKKGIFGAYVAEGSISITVNFTSLGGPYNMGDCRVWPEGAEASAQPLLDALNAGALNGTIATLKVDQAALQGSQPAVENRIFVFNGDVPGVRYFWIGSWYETADENHLDARVKDWVDDEENGVISYTLYDGAVGLRDWGSPKETVKLHCSNGGEVSVTLTKG